ncbi:MAG: hypothetical protein US69_C0001G0036 [candidate division TM6 bacterium GW2011_GWF2_38_10]|nr:MAG: hypothetical protein US69_C0001G0036 [candidate division TM6 bacterium GW2011_GWF2_38_10]
MDSRSRGLTAKAENDNRRLACHPWGRSFSPQPEDPSISYIKIQKSTNPKTQI